MVLLYIKNINIISFLIIYYLKKRNNYSILRFIYINYI